MRLRAVFDARQPLVLPTSYNHAVQGMIYNLLPYDYRERLHDLGYFMGGRRFKLFTFSRLLGKSRYVNRSFEFEKGFELKIGSPKEEFIGKLWKSIATKPETDLAGRSLRVVELELVETYTEPLPENILVKTLSPITVYSTLYTATGERKTYFYSPYEEEFHKLLENNLKKKAYAAYGVFPTGKINIGPVRCREVVVKFKDQIVKAWSGVFKVSGDPVLVKTGYEAGLGSKNSAGFGMVEEIA